MMRGTVRTTLRSAVTAGPPLRDHVLDALLLLGGPATPRAVSAVAQACFAVELPTAFMYRDDVAAGGLMSYAPNYSNEFLHAAQYVDMILNGSKPGDLPVEQPTTFELVINLKTARALGVTIPPSVLAQADQVIE